MYVYVHVYVCVYIIIYTTHISYIANKVPPRRLRQRLALVAEPARGGTKKGGSVNLQFIFPMIFPQLS